MSGFDDFDFDDWYDGSPDKKVKAAVTAAKAVHKVSKKTGLKFGKMSFLIAGGLAAAKAVESAKNKKNVGFKEGSSYEYEMHTENGVPVFQTKQEKVNTKKGCPEQKTIRLRENLNGEYDPEPRRVMEEKKKASRKFWIFWGLWMGGALLLIFIGASQ